MKLSKRVNYKKVTKKGKNGKKSNRVKNSIQSKKRQNRKKNKKTQNGGETVPETIECETQIIVEKPALFLRKDGSNTGFFYVRQDIELPEANLKTGSVVELKDGKLIEHGEGEDEGLGNNVPSAGKELPVKSLLVNGEIHKSLTAVNKPLYSIRCGGQQAQNAHKEFSLDKLAEIIVNNIRKNIRKYQETLPDTVPDTEKDKLDYVFEMTFRDLNKITGLDTIRQLELQVLDLYKNNFNEIMEQKQKIDTLARESGLSSEQIFNLTIRGILNLETYSAPSINNNNLESTSVLERAKMFQMGGKQKDGNIFRFKHFLLSSAAVIGLGGGILVGGTGILFGVLTLMIACDEISQDLNAERVSKWICSDFIKLEREGRIREQLLALNFNGFSKEFKGYLVEIKKLFEQKIKEYNVRINQLTKNNMINDLLNKVQEYINKPTRDKHKWKKFMKLLNEFKEYSKTFEVEPLPEILKYVFSNLIYNKNNNNENNSYENKRLGTDAMKLLIYNYLKTPKKINYGLKIVLFGILRTEYYMKYLDKKGKCEELKTLIKS